MLILKTMENPEKYKEENIYCFLKLNDYIINNFLD